MAQDSTRFTLKFGGEENDINAATYGTILINTVTLLEEANKELQTGAHLEIKVKSERKGSYLVDLGVQSMAVVATLAPLMTAENMKVVTDTASRVIKTATGAYEYWKKLKGEKPKEIKEKDDSVTVTTGENSIVIIDKSVHNLVFNNKRGQDAIANTFNALSKDESVEEFAVLDTEEKTLFSAEKEEFPLLSKKVDSPIPEKKTDSETTQLYIIRQSFDQSLKSDYLYRGFKISVSITDKAFWEAIDKGERYGKGDILLAELQIEQEFNKAINTYENKGYTVIKVLQHKPRAEQPELFDNVQ